MSNLLVSLLLFSHLIFAEENNLENKSGDILLDRIIAEVNGEAILFSDVKKKVDDGPLVVVSEFPSKQEDQPIEKALQDEINFALILQEAERLSVEVDDPDVESEIQSFLKRKGVAKTQLLDFLSGQNKSYEEYKNDFKNQMILRRFQGRVISPLVKVTDKDVENYFLRKAAASQDYIEIFLKQIVLQVKSSTTDDSMLESKMKLAQTIIQKLNGGLSFDEAIKLFSDVQGSDSEIKGVTMNQLSKDIREGIEKLEVAQFSQPIKTQMGIHIFYLQDKSLSKSKIFQEQKDNLEAELKNSEMAKQTDRWLSETRAKSKIKIHKG